jgi:hypothetical protein
MCLCMLLCFCLCVCVCVCVCILSIAGLTKRVSQVVYTLSSYSEGPGFKCRPGRPAVLTEISRDFPHSLQACAG